MVSNRLNGKSENNLCGLSPEPVGRSNRRFFAYLIGVSISTPFYGKEVISQWDYGQDTAKSDEAVVM